MLALMGWKAQCNPPLIPDVLLAAQLGMQAYSHIHSRWAVNPMIVQILPVIGMFHFAM
jgi:hypothetical protein